MGENLITSYIESVTKDGSLAAAIREMNTALGTHYINSRLREWERGDRCPSANVINYMLEHVIPPLIETEGVSRGRASEILNKCVLPRK
ncbi:MAG: hypothetical protein ABW168_05795 [Sedimenticola sp.]